METRRASIVVVDLVRGLTYPDLWNQLAVYLATCESTTFLLGDYDRVETASDAALSTADAVLWLRQTPRGEAIARTLEVLKVRGQAPLRGQHNFRVTYDGLEVFPRWPTPKVRLPYTYAGAKLAVGIEAIDDVLGGGVPAGDALLVEGPSGAGKSVLATHFIAQGARQGQPGLVFLFEERPDRFVQRAETFGLGFENMVHAGLVEVLSFRGRDMSPDEVIAEIQCAVTAMGARRVVIDSAGCLDLVLTGSRGPHDCLWRLLDRLTGAGVTVWPNNVPDEAQTSLHSLVDDVLVRRRVEQDTHYENRMSVTKMRWNAHTTRQLAYEIKADGLRVVEPTVKPAPTGCLFDVPSISAPPQNGEALAVAS